MSTHFSLFLCWLPFPPLLISSQTVQRAPATMDMDEESQLQLALSLSKEEHQQVGSIPSFLFNIPLKFYSYHSAVLSLFTTPPPPISLCHYLPDCADTLSHNSTALWTHSDAHSSLTWAFSSLCHLPASITGLLCLCVRSLSHKYSIMWQYGKFAGSFNGQKASMCLYLLTGATQPPRRRVDAPESSGGEQTWDGC